MLTAQTSVFGFDTASSIGPEAKPMAPTLASYAQLRLSISVDLPKSLNEVWSETKLFFILPEMADWSHMTWLEPQGLDPSQSRVANDLTLKVSSWNRKKWLKWTFKTPQTVSGQNCYFWNNCGAIFYKVSQNTHTHKQSNTEQILKNQTRPAIPSWASFIFFK